jgi:hypothetical protein
MPTVVRSAEEIARVRQVAREVLQADTRAPWLG